MIDGDTPELGPAVTVAVNAARADGATRRFATLAGRGSADFPSRFIVLKHSRVCMRYRIGLICGLAGLLVASTAATAATRYVSDELSINMRLGPGTGYRISQLLDAGTQLETLSEENGWTRIRTSGGQVGYVLTRFLSEEAAARTQMAQLKNQARELQSENAELKEDLDEALDGSQALGDSKRELVEQNKSLSNELRQIRETSADAIRIGEENERFREQLLSMRSDNERLRHENGALKSRREGMKIGALIMVGGIVVGLLLPLFRKGRKGNWDSL